MFDELVQLLSAPIVAKKVDRKSLIDFRNFFVATFKDNLYTNVLEHPQGFSYIKFLIDEKRSLRLHFWPIDWLRDEEQVVADIHDHKYQLTSVILNGILEQETYSIFANNEGTHYCSDISYSEGTSSPLESCKYVDISLKHKQIFKPSTMNRLKAGEVHRVLTPKRPVATIVFTEDSENYLNPKVIILKGQPLPPRFKRASIANEKLYLIEHSLDLMMKEDIF